MGARPGATVTAASLPRAIVAGSSAVAALLSGSPVAPKTAEAHRRAVREYVALVANEGVTNVKVVTEATLTVAIAAKLCRFSADSRVRKKASDLLLPATIDSWAGSVRAGVRRLSATSTGWRLAPGTPGATAVAAYKRCFRATIISPGRLAALAEAEAPRTPVTATAVRAMWRVAHAPRQRLLVRALVLSRALLLRPSELLMLRDDFACRTAGTLDDEGFPVVPVFVPRLKSGGYTPQPYAIALFRDRRAGDEAAVMDPLTAWAALAEAAAGGSFGQVIGDAPRGAEPGTALSNARAKATSRLRKLAAEAALPHADRVTFYDGRHTGEPVKASGFSDVLRFQGQWANVDGVMGTYVAPSLATVASRMRQAFRELDGRKVSPSASE